MYIKDRFKPVKYLTILLRFHPEMHKQLVKIKKDRDMKWEDVVYLAMINLKEVK